MQTGMQGAVTKHQLPGRPLVARRESFDQEKEFNLPLPDWDGSDPDQNLTCFPRIMLVPRILVVMILDKGGGMSSKMLLLKE